MRRITNVNRKGSKTSVTFEVFPDANVGADPDVFNWVCVDTPAQSMLDALAELVPHVCAWIGVPKAWRKGIEIRGVSFSWADDIMGATITALKTFEDAKSPLVINTPHKPERPYSETEDETCCLPADTVEALVRVLDEVGLYIDGKRHQPNLFDGVEAEQPQPAT